MVSSSSTFVASKEQISCDLNGESVILSLKNSSYYGLNSVGSFIWTLVQSPKTFTQIKEAILEHYEVEPETCERDLMELLDDLLENQLVEIS
ncbi:MAG: PqqD family protein [Methanothrix sp.]|nr:MAG: PqqD family protein [Methanothrix sp.]